MGLDVPSTMRAATMTKGGLWIATGTRTIALHAVPSVSGQTLVADPSQTDGWIADNPTDRGDYAFKRSGCIAETFSRRSIEFHNLTSGAGSGVLRLSAIPLPANRLITSITFMSGTTAAVNPTHQWFALFDSSLSTLAKTVDDTSAAWAANTEKTLALSATFTTTYSGLHYIGYVVTATTTVPTVCGIADFSSAMAALAPALGGLSTTSLTDPASLGGAASAITGSQANRAWGYVS